jgi:hypothetical protein
MVHTLFSARCASSYDEEVTDPSTFGCFFVTVLLWLWRRDFINKVKCTVIVPLVYVRGPRAVEMCIQSCSRGES